MAEAPNISIFVLADGSGSPEDAVQNLLEESLPSREVWLVDTSPTPAVAEPVRDPRLHVWRWPGNVASALNVAIARSTGRWGKIVRPGHSPDPASLAEQWRFATQDGNATLVVDHTDGASARPEAPADWLDTPHPDCGDALFRIDRFWELGGIDASLGHLWDLDLWIRFAACGEVAWRSVNGARAVDHRPRAADAAERARIAARTRSASLGAVPRSDAWLRVALEVDRLDEGGLETVVQDLAHGLRGHEVEPVIVCGTAGGRIARELADDGIEVVSLRADTERHVAEILDDRDIHVWNAHFAFAGTRVAAERGVPVVSTIHNAYAWMDRAHDGAMRAADPYVESYVAVSHSVASFSERRFDIPRDRITVIRNALTRSHDDADRVTREQARSLLGIEDHKRLLVQVGRIDPIKAPLALVEAAALLAERQPDLLVWLVGPTPDDAHREEVEAVIDARGLTGTVQLTGLRRDVPTILAAADAFVLPSFIEGLSLAVVEAFAAGVPAVLTRTGDADFLVGTGGQAAGRVVDGPLVDPVYADGRSLEAAASERPPAHAAAVAEAIHAVLQEPGRYRSAALQRAEELAPLLRPERFIEAHLDLFARTARRGARRRSTAERDRATFAQTRAAAQLGNARDALAELDGHREREARAARSLARVEDHSRVADELRRDAEGLVGNLSETRSMADRALDKLRIKRRLGQALRGR